MAEADPYAGQESLLTSSDDWVAITPHDTNPIGFVPKAIACGTTAGNIVMKGTSGNAMTLPFTAGEIKPLRPLIITTASTATPIYGLK